MIADPSLLLEPGRATSMHNPRIIIVELSLFGEVHFLQEASVS
jgi:hypothetical protein